MNKIQTPNSKPQESIKPQTSVLLEKLGDSPMNKPQTPNSKRQESIKPQTTARVLVKLGDSPMNKLQTPNSKPQESIKPQIPVLLATLGDSSKGLRPRDPRPFGAWCLRLLWNLMLGIWSFRFLGSLVLGIWSFAGTHGIAADTSSAKLFRHPGVLLNQAQLDLIKSRVAAGTEPQKSAFEALRACPQGALDYTPHPRATVECGPRSNPDLGCKSEQADSEAAYAQALLWQITGNKAYAENAVKIMNAWSGTLTGGHKLENAPVQAAWCAEVWPRAAEIIRATYPGWPAAEVANFQKMLATQYVPSLVGGSCENGNKELSMSEALINIGVFNDDRSTFDLGVKMWRGRAPAYIYLSTDGPTPVKPAGCEMAIWGNKGHTTPLVDGLLQETCRDSQHANMALSAMVNAAETARQQGMDLYAEQGKRMMAALEYQAQFLAPNNAPVPQYLAFNKHPTWEIAYNHFHNRVGVNLPKMAAVLPTNRPTGVNHHMAWETLTHADMGAVGLPPVASP